MRTRHTVRRVLWIVPTLVFTSLVLFGFLSTLGAHRGDAARLPRFFQPQPQSVRERADGAVRRIAGEGSEAEDGARDLAGLGGAALPHVLPRLDALPPRARGRVALALGPVARRMGVGTREELLQPETAVLFWTRFWQDRSIDFRPGVAKRAVRRVMQHASEGRREDVLSLDTFALPELILALPTVRSPEDVVTTARLCQLLAHVSGKPWTIDETASAAQAETARRTWLRWWRDSRLQFVNLEGPERLFAMVTETEYGRWAEAAAYSRLGTTAQGQPVLDVLSARAPLSLSILVAAILAGYLGSIALGTWAAASRNFDRMAAPFVLALIAVPLVVLLPSVAPTDPAGHVLLAVLAVSLMTSATLSRYQRGALRRELATDYARTRRAFGLPPLRIAWVSVRGASSALGSLLGRDLPTLLSLCLLVEYALDLPGLGPVTVQALKSGDVSWLMAVGLGSMTLAALMQILSDRVLLALDPRIDSQALERKGELS